MNQKQIIEELQSNKIKSLPCLHIHQKTEYFGSLYGQDIEPAGQYISYNDHNFKLDIPNYEYKIVTFENPLILEYVSTGANGWKKTLSEKYNGLTGKRLSNKIKKDGYDIIITIDSESMEIMEIVKL